MAKEKSGVDESRRGSTGYPEEANEASHRGRKSFEVQGGKGTKHEEHAEEEKRQAGDGRVHYKGPSRQLGGYDMPDTETGEPQSASGADRDETSNQGDTAGSGRK